MEDPRALSQSAARALTVLDLIADAGEEMGVREIARRVGLSPSIVQRLLATLEHAGYVERTEAGKFRVGFRAFQVGNAFVAGSDLVSATMPELRALADAHHVNAFLGVRQGAEMIYLAAIQSRGAIAIANAPGSRAPLHSTAFGKALLAELSDEEVAEILGPGPYARLTARTTIDLAGLLAELADVRRTGLAVCDEENLAGVFAVGAVVRDATGAAVAGLSGAVTALHLEPSEVERLSALVRGAAERISRRLGAGGATFKINRKP